MFATPVMAWPVLWACAATTGGKLGISGIGARQFVDQLVDQSHPVWTHTKHKINRSWHHGPPESASLSGLGDRRVVIMW